MAPAARRRNAKLSFAFVFPDKNGRFKVQEVVNPFLPVCLLLITLTTLLPLFFFVLHKYARILSVIFDMMCLAFMS